MEPWEHGREARLLSHIVLELDGLERSELLLLTEEREGFALDAEPVDLVEHLRESVLVLHVGASHPGHTHVAECQSTVGGVIAAEEAVAIGTAADEHFLAVENQGEGVLLAVDGRSGDTLHGGELPNGAFQRFVIVRAAAGGHREKQHSGCQNLFHSFLF